MRLHGEGRGGFETCRWSNLMAFSGRMGAFNFSVCCDLRAGNALKHGSSIGSLAQEPPWHNSSSRVRPLASVLLAGASVARVAFVGHHGGGRYTVDASIALTCSFVLEFSLHCCKTPKLGCYVAYRRWTGSEIVSTFTPEACNPKPQHPSKLLQERPGLYNFPLRSAWGSTVGCGLNAALECLWPWGGLGYEV